MRPKRVLKMRAELMAALREYIGKRGWMQSEAAKELGTTHPRVSALMKGAWRDFSVDMLLAWSDLGQKVHPLRADEFFRSGPMGKGDTGFFGVGGRLPAMTTCSQPASPALAAAWGDVAAAKAGARVISCQTTSGISTSS